MRGRAGRSENCPTELTVYCLKIFIRKNLSNLSKLKIVEAIDKIFFTFKIETLQAWSQAQIFGQKTGNLEQKIE